MCSADPEDLWLVSGHRNGEAIAEHGQKQTESYLLLLETESERKAPARKTKETETEGRREKCSDCFRLNEGKTRTEQRN